MRAVGYRTSLPIDAADALLDLDVPAPEPGPRDLLVAVKAVSVNPVDAKVRIRSAPEAGAVKILGWDAAGIVRAVGKDVTLFKPGEEVFYAGSIARQGTNAELHLVDERIVGHKPKSLGDAEAAALPLTAITAWELLFDRLGAHRGEASAGASLLIIGGAGGVGSILIQIARRLTALNVIATASRSESRDWCLEHGARHVIDHRKPFAEQLRGLGVGPVDYVASLTATDQHFQAIVEAVKPQGRFGLIDDPDIIDIRLLKQKAVSTHWEFMFTRSLFETPDMIAQHDLLEEVSSLVDAGVIRTTLAQNLGPINAANLKKAHALIESGKSTGKIVLEGF